MLQTGLRLWRRRQNGLYGREVDGNKIRNHVLRTSTDGAASFSAPVEISNDGWQVPSCPHSGPSIGRDRRGCR